MGITPSVQNLGYRTNSSSHINSKLILWCLGLAPLHLLCSSLFGFETKIYWPLVHIIDKAQLQTQPFVSLLCLHTQVPGLNAVVAFALHLSESLGCSINIVIAICYHLLGFLAGIFLSHLTYWTTRSMRLAFLSVLCFWFNPGFFYYLHDVDYNFLVCPFLAGVVFLLFRLVHAPTLTRLIYFIIALILLVWTRQAYIPTLGAALLIGTMLILNHLHRAWLYSHRRSSGAIVVLGLFLLFAWPAKNYFIYGHFINTSLRGFNLIWRTPVNYYVDEYLISLRTQPEIEEKWRSKFVNYLPLCRDQEFFYKPYLRETGPSWHNFIFLETDEPLAKKALEWRMKDPLGWAKLTLKQYILMTRSTFIAPYRLTIRGPDNIYYLWYAKVINDLLFFNLRPFIESIFPNPTMYQNLNVKGSDMPITIFGLVTIPLVMLSAAFLLFRKPITAERYTLIIAFCFIAWNLAIPALTDGFEGNRMRFESSALWFLIVAWLAHRALLRNSQVKRRKV